MQNEFPNATQDWPTGGAGNWEPKTQSATMSRVTSDRRLASTTRRTTSESLYFSRYSSPVGPLFVGFSEHGLVCLEFGAKAPARVGGKAIEWAESADRAAPYILQLDEYFAGRRREFSFALDLRGTEFQKKCWRALLEIPYGETRSYADIARAVGRPHAFRAVGTANHTNPIAIVVPCHRVIGSNGDLTGYGGGLHVKRRLLALEGAKWREQYELARVK